MAQESHLLPRAPPLGFNPSVHQSNSIPYVQLHLLTSLGGFADAFLILSMSVNVLATSLIAYKAWEYRRMVKKYFSSDGSTTSTWKALALLVESGTIYCALLMFLVVYQLKRPFVITSSASDFDKIGWYFADGCLLPIAAIYPTIIILLVAMRRSPIEHGVSQANEESGTGPGPATASTLIFGRSAVESMGTRHSMISAVKLADQGGSEQVNEGLSSSEKIGVVVEV
ncbi:hypothetical protein BD311DRAFT_778114 [Dichomitus squalens]|uniref:Uncharacterized protein n=1 Tax=Dichomitus squalens TaxID=114155 RepID=A0A4Q9MQV7_9APHY|nr:hypothetical protein BD311DRAFT_778114 [Dichomitus squalens]